jgi:hypothetical protein
VRSANLQSQGWSDRARSYLTDYARDNLHFTAEEVRHWAHEHAIPPLDKPTIACAWGGVFRIAATMKTIVPDGTATTRIPPQHSKLCTRWRSNITSSDAPAVSSSPTVTAFHLATGEGKVACGAQRRMRSAASRATLIAADSKRGVTCLNCKGTVAYERAK